MQKKYYNVVKNSQTNSKFLTEIYKKQNKWAAGSDINIINNSIKTIGKEFALTEDDNE